MEDYTETTEDTKLSKLNSGQLTNFALHDLLIEYFRKYRKGAYKEANAVLDCIWVILGSDEEEESEVVKSYEKIETEIKNLGTLGKPQKKGFEKLNDKDIISLTKQKELINKKAMFLGRLKNKQGKGTAYDVGDDDYMD